MVFQTTTNHENMHEMEVVLRSRHVDEGRSILARSEPEYEYDLDVDGHNELLPPQGVAESTLRNFDNLLTSSARRKEDGDASHARGLLWTGCA